MDEINDLMMSEVFIDESCCGNLFVVIISLFITYSYMFAVISYNSHGWFYSKFWFAVAQTIGHFSLKANYYSCLLDLD